MNGICGLIAFDGRCGDDEIVLNKCLEALAHRGLAKGVWARMGAAVFGHVFSGKTTPVLNHADAAGGEFMLVADAKLDNRSELGQKLGLSEFELARLSDNQILARAYQTWGEDCVLHLGGNYVCAIWNPQLRRLFCFRDHFAQRPIYYHYSDNRLVFASEIKALLCFPWVPRKLCEARLVEKFSMQGTGLNERITFYQDILRIPAAGTLTYDAGPPRVETYWRPDAKSEIRRDDDDAYVSGFFERLSTAVKRRIEGADRVGLLLSGGFDSSSIAALAAHHLAKQGKKLYAYTAVPIDANTDEKRSIAYYVDALRSKVPNIEVAYLTGENRSVMADATLFRICEEPANLLLNRIHELVQAAHMDGVTTMLAGFGGDQAATPRGGSGLPELFLNGRFSLAYQELLAASQRWGQPPWRVLLSQVARPLIPEWAWRAQLLARYRQALWRVNSMCTPELARRSGALPALRRNTSLAYRVLPSIRATSCRGLAFCMSGRGYESMQNLTAHYQMELGMPMLDKDLVGYALALPPEQHVKGGQRRYMVRRAMAGWLPEALLERPDANVFMVPDLNHRILAELPEIERELANFDASPEIAGMIDLDKIRSKLKQLSEGKSKGAATLVLNGMTAARFIKWFKDEYA